jgi:cyclomaltodextrinase
LAEGKYRCLIHDKEIFVFERYNDKEKLIVAVNLLPRTITLKFKEKLKEWESNQKKNEFKLEKESYLVLSS